MINLILKNIFIINEKIYTSFILKKRLELTGEIVEFIAPMIALSGVFFNIVVFGPIQLSQPIEILSASVEFTPINEFCPTFEKPEITTWDDIKQLLDIIEWCPI